MRRWIYGIFWGVWLGAAAHLPAASQTRLELVLDHEAVRPGQTVMAGIRFKLAPGWHTYWRNPGDAGQAATIEWQLPNGITAAEILWPVPEKLIDSGITSYVYQDEVVLLAPLSIPANVAAGPITIKAKASWIECKESCIPAQGEAQAQLVIGNAPQLSTRAGFIETWKKRLPNTEPKPHARAAWRTSSEPDQRTLVIDWDTTADPAALDFFPDIQRACEFAGETTRSNTAPGQVVLLKSVKKVSDAWPAQLGGLLVVNPGKEASALQAFEVNFALQTTGESNAVKASVSANNTAPTPLIQKTLLGWLVYAFIGGLILNIMPCVLPVVALKVLGFVNQSKENPARVRQLGLVYGLGVLGSFLGLALLVIGVKAAGQQAGWGMQFGNPIFVVALTVLVTLVALNLFGVFEVILSYKVLAAADGLASREGPAGAFFNGVLATVLATPCTAPFLGAALGFAFTQPSAIIILVFLTVGAGLAAPYVVLSWAPQWLKFLPKPGAWMEKFKIAMGFPMLATAIWLYQLAPAHYGKRFWWLGIFLVIAALAAWIFGEFVQRGRKRTGLAAAVAGGLFLFGCVYVLEGQLDWRHPIPEEEKTDGKFAEAPGGIEWRHWSPSAMAQARGEGRPVFVDFTADWCATCQVNKKFSIEIPAVKARLKEINAVALLADYTRVPPVITEELQRFGRAGVPLVLVYPRQTNQPPIVLPELLTPQIVLSALAEAAK